MTVRILKLSGMKSNADRKRYKALRDFFESHGRMATFAEMVPLFGVKSKNAVYKVVERMVETGALVRDPSGCLNFPSQRRFLE